MKNVPPKTQASEMISIRLCFDIPSHEYVDPKNTVVIKEFQVHANAEERFALPRKCDGWSLRCNGVSKCFVIRRYIVR
jgi:hypothetical protein